MAVRRLKMRRAGIVASHVGGKGPMRVCVTGAAGNIAYALLFQVASGRMLGPKQPIVLVLLDIPPMAQKMEGVAMEIRDCAFPLVTELVVTTDYDVAFRNVDVAMLVGAKPRGPGMVRADLLSANAAIFKGQGEALNRLASRNVKVVVVGNPANTNCLIASHYAPDLPKENFTALTRLDQNRALSELSRKTSIPVKEIKNVIIWGNHSKTQYPDISHSTCGTRPTPSTVSKEWVRGDFLNTVQNRGAAIIQARGLSSAASAANAAVEHVRDWILGTPSDEFVSMAVYSDGTHYGVPAGIIYSFPVVCRNGQWQIVDGLSVDAFSRQLMDATAAELLGEKKAALG